MGTCRTSHERPRGLALPLLLVVTAILMALMAGIMTNNSNALLQVSQDGHELSAQYAAEAGAWRAVSHLAEKGIDQSPVILWDRQPLEKVNATYTVEVTRGPAVIDGIRVPDSQHFYIRSQGLTTGDDHPAGQVVAMLVQTTASGSFDTAIFAQESILLKNGVTDVSEGSGSQYSSFSYSGTSPTSGKAHIGTNSVAADSVRLVGNSEVDGGDGDILVGPGGDDLAVTGDPTNYGSVSALTSTRMLKPVRLPLAPSVDHRTITHTTLFPPGSYGDIVVDSGCLELSPDGIYQFRSIRLINNGRLRLLDADDDTPDTKVYLENGLDIVVGKIANLRGAAKNLQFLAAGDSPIHITQKGAGGIYMMYAPEAGITIDEGSKIKGAVIGKSVALVGSDNDQARVRYDLELMGLDLLGDLGGGGAAGIRVLHTQSF